MVEGIILVVLSLIASFIKSEEVRSVTRWWWAGLTVGALIFGFGLTKEGFFYAEPGYVYHVRTALGNEKVVEGPGYKFYPFGRYNAWKRAMTVQAVTGNTELFDAEKETKNTSASLPPQNIMFLDQVDANAQATTRFSIPTDEEKFLYIAREYRSPENLLRTALMPAFKETLQATASLMSAEDYYSGGRTEFNSEFEKQMTDGIYIVRRKEVKEATSRAKRSANASTDNPADFGDDAKTVFIVEKQVDETGNYLRKPQNFIELGITVVDSRITEMKPNTKFVERMQLKQKASADRAIAREQRVQEEEQRLLAIARGEREVAERQAKAKVEQIQKTTEAETEKQLALTSANKLKEQAAIEKETSEIHLEKAKIEADTQRTLADAEAYAKKAILEADNALAQKLEAEVRIQQLWAEAYSKRAVPTNVFGASGGDTPTGGDQEVKAFMQMLTLDAAERLSYDRTLKKGK